MRLPAYILRDNNGLEFLLVTDGPRRFRMQIEGDSIADGPVRLAYDLSGLSNLDITSLTLRRLSAINRLGRLPRALYPPDPIVARRVRALQAWDAQSAGASQREIAAAIFGDHMVTEASLHSMRKRVVRLIRQARGHIRAAHARFFAP